VAIGPILLGIRKPVYLLVPGSEVDDIVNMAAIAVYEAQRGEDKHADVKEIFSRYEVSVS
jgi:malate dehydrogenase (oxaloacetate-decarboxylating)(NADP+)